MSRHRHLSTYGSRAAMLMAMAMAVIAALDAIELMPRLHCGILALVVLASGIGSGIARDSSGKWHWW